MRSLPFRPVRPLIVAAATAALASTTLAAAPQASAAWADTRTQAVDVDGRVAGPELAPGQAIHIAVSLQLRNKAELDAFTAAILSGRSQARMTSAQVLERHAPTPEQAEAVAAHLRGDGFSHVEIAKNRMLVTADGTAATIKTAFNTTLHHFDVDGRDAYANVTPARVPAHLAGIVSGVHGLDTVHTVHLHYVRSAGHERSVMNPNAAASAVGHLPKEFATIYDADGLPTASNTTIAIMSAGDISQTLTDFAAYVSQNGYQAPVIEQVVVGQQGTDTSGVIEWDLDSQTSFATAGASVKKLMFYIANNVQSLEPFVEAFNQAASDNEAQVINASLGTCETGEKNNGDEASMDASMQIGVAQGQTFTISSGDSGAYECSRSKIGASYPAVSPYATAIGGTTLSTTGQTVYDSETAWSCKSYLLCQQLLGGGGGGGTSTTEAAPTWQTKALGQITGRSIPDISFSGDPASGAILVVNGGTKQEQVGGTSLSAPMFMGFWARIQTKNNNQLPSPNAGIYKFTSKPANAQAYTHDVTSGNQGFAAGPGWDLTTGYGSLDVGAFSAFIDKLRGH
jgi:pseudomonalisin/xanthomonalisin